MCQKFVSRGLVFLLHVVMWRALFTISNGWAKIAIFAISIRRNRLDVCMISPMFYLGANHDQSPTQCAGTAGV